MHLDVFGEKLLVFASLQIAFKIKLFEKLYQTLVTVFHHNIKNLEVRKKYTPIRVVFSTLFSVFDLL